jgi:tetraacyldisaccharide 4'-kinase
LSLLYGLVVRVRRFLFRKGWRAAVRLDCPVVVVGNLSVGGTGKTPLVCWLAGRLRELGWKPGIVTRGYGGTLQGERLVAAGDDAAVVGDEPLLLFLRAAVPVAVGRDRPAAGRLLIEAGCNLIISDDGLQHYRLARDCEIIVIDGERRLGNGWLLPGGPLREPAARIGEADGVVVNGPAGQPGAGLSMRIVADHAVALRGESAAPLSAFAGIVVHAIAGIGNPARFFQLLSAHGVELIEHPRDDHAPLARADIDFPDDRPVLMTEKDAVKCKVYADQRHWYVPVDAAFDRDDASALLDIVVRGITGRFRLAREVSHG